jgi:hypothetical protein
MIYHMVLLKVRKNASDADVERVFTTIGNLRDKIPGITGFEWGPYSSNEGLNRGYTHAFCMTFTNAAARDTYLPHPEHEIVKGHVVEILEGGIDGVLAFDFEA